MGLWDETLFAGAARFYADGRLPYPPEMVPTLARALALDGAGRLLDIGCGPGSVTIPLAGVFAAAVGVDADPGMIDVARERAERAGVRTVRFCQLRAEELPADLGTFRVITFAQSFHWFDRERVAATARGMLDPGGAVVHIQATTHEGVRGPEALPAPEPPREAIPDLVRAYLGEHRRAGRSTLPGGETPGDEARVFRDAGFDGPRQVPVESADDVFVRDEDQVVASVFSLSWAAPHLFGDRRADFEADLRRLLRETAPDGRFAERRRQVVLDIWVPR